MLKRTLSGITYSFTCILALLLLLAGKKEEVKRETSLQIAKSNGGNDMSSLFFLEL